MVSQFKIWPAVAVCFIFMSSCNKDESDSLLSFRLETRDTDFGLDTLETNTVYSSLVNINKLKLKYKGVTSDPTRAFEFRGETDTFNKFFLLSEQDFFPSSNTGIVVVKSAYGKLNSISGQAKCDLYNTDGIAIYRTLPNGNCQFYLPSVEVYANVILPGNPKFKAAVLLEFPIPPR